MPASGFPVVQVYPSVWRSRQTDVLDPLMSVLVLVHSSLSRGVWLGRKEKKGRCCSKDKNEGLNFVSTWRSELLQVSKGTTMRG